MILCKRMLVSAFWGPNQRDLVRVRTLDILFVTQEPEDSYLATSLVKHVFLKKRHDLYNYSTQNIIRLLPMYLIVDLARRPQFTIREFVNQK